MSVQGLPALRVLRPEAAGQVPGAALPPETWGGSLLALPPLPHCHLAFLCPVFCLRRAPVWMGSSPYIE